MACNLSNLDAALRGGLLDLIKVRLMCVGAGPTLDYADAAEFLAGFEPIMTQRADVKQSPAYEVLRASSRRLLMFIEQEIARQGGGNVTLYADQLAVVGSVRVVLPGLSELNALGLIRDARYQKRHLIGLSDGWRGISKRDAMISRPCASAAHTAADDAAATGFGQCVT